MPFHIPGKLYERIKFEEDLNDLSGKANRQISVSLKLLPSEPNQGRPRQILLVLAMIKDFGKIKTNIVRKSNEALILHLALAVTSIMSNNVVSAEYI